MAERNGFTKFLRAWQIIVPVAGLFGGIVAWQFVTLHTAVSGLQREHAEALPLARSVITLTARVDTIQMEQSRREGILEEIPGLREAMSILRNEMALRTTVIAVVDARLGGLERELGNVKSVLEDIRRSMTGRQP